MKIAIHNRPGSFSDCWISYCKENNITFNPIKIIESNFFIACINLTIHKINTK